MAEKLTTSFKQLKTSDFDLSEEEIAECREAFQMFDKNGDGSITTEELGKTLKSLGQNPTAQDLKDMIAGVDVDENGTIEFNEFLIMLKKKMKDPGEDAYKTEEEMIKEAFQKFDVNKTGIISADELRQVMASIGEKLTNKELEDMIREADSNGDGFIDYQEFVKIIKSK